VTRVAWIGAGTMGLPMGRNLAAAGNELVACDLDPARAAALSTETAESPAAAARGCEMAIVSLPSPIAVEDAVLGPTGVVHGLPRGAVVVDMSTSPPALSRRLAAELEPAGIEAVDAPVSGGPTGAEAATLAIMVGGQSGAVERVRPLLSAMGSAVEHVGGHGAGQTVKLCNNLMVACTMITVGEACRLLEREGIDPAHAYDVFIRSTSDSSVLRRRFPVPGVRPEHPASTDYAPMFRLDLIVKDLGLALELAAEHGVETPLGETAARLYDEALAAGYAELDYSAVYLVQS
jgi:3-hydroxyisobutyrate dehydrogenase